MNCINNIAPPYDQNCGLSSSHKDFKSSAFYNTLWFLVLILVLVMITTFFGMLKIGRIPPLATRPTNSQILAARRMAQTIPEHPFDHAILPQFVFVMLAQITKLVFFLLVANMAEIKIDEVYLWLVFVAETVSLYCLAIALSAEFFRWVRLEQRIASSYLQYTIEDHRKKNTLKKESFVLYQVFLILIFMVMLGESFGYVVKPDREPEKQQYLDEKLLFLDPTTELSLTVIYPFVASLFLVLGKYMNKRLALMDKRLVEAFGPSINQAKLITGVPVILVGVRFFIEFLFHTQLAEGCDHVLNGDSRSYQFIIYWFCSIVLTEYACYCGVVGSLYLRKKYDWDRLHRLPLKEKPEHDMANLLGALIIEIEENRFKPNLIEDSEITYGKSLGTTIDRYQYTEDSMAVGRRQNRSRTSRDFDQRSRSKPQLARGLLNSNEAMSPDTTPPTSPKVIEHNEIAIVGSQQKTVSEMDLTKRGSSNQPFTSCIESDLEPRPNCGDLSTIRSLHQSRVHEISQEQHRPPLIAGKYYNKYNKARQDPNSLQDMESRLLMTESQTYTDC